MKSFVFLYSKNSEDILRFLQLMYEEDFVLTSEYVWKKYYDNPSEIADIIGIYVDNHDKFDLQLWVCIDEDIYMNITQHNANHIIKYIFERFPY